MDTTGVNDILYVADYGNNSIRKIEIDTSSATNIGTWSVSTIVTGLSAPRDVTVDSNGNLYIPNYNGHDIRKWVPGSSSSAHTRFAGNGTAGTDNDWYIPDQATSMYLYAPSGVKVYNNHLYIAEYLGCIVRKVNLEGETNIMTAIAGRYERNQHGGDGEDATSAALKNPRSIDFDEEGNLLILTTDAHRLRKVDATTNIITTIAGTGGQGTSNGNGTALDATFKYPGDLVVDNNTQEIYIAGWYGDDIRKLTPVYE